MPKYLVKANYSSGEGVKGLIADGGTTRVKAVEQLMASVGGKVESFYYALGEVDVYAIIESDEASAIAASLTVNASGLTTCEIVKLVEPAEIDAAVKKSPMYDAPGPSA